MNVGVCLVKARPCWSRVNFPTSTSIWLKNMSVGLILLGLTKNKKMLQANILNKMQFCIAIKLLKFNQPGFRFSKVRLGNLNSSKMNAK